MAGFLQGLQSRLPEQVASRLPAQERVDEVTGFFWKVPLPKETVIQNWRLAIVFRLLQVTAGIFAFAQVMAAGAWQTDYLPHGKGLAVWRESPEDISIASSFFKSSLGPESAAGANTMPIYCTKPEAFAYNWSTRAQYTPTHCKKVLAGEDYHDAGGKLYYPTFAQDIHVWESSSASDCGEETKTKCEASEDGAVYAEEKNEGGKLVTCSCRRKDEFFIPAAEEAPLAFVHGYEVPMDQEGWWGRKQVGHSLSLSAVVEDLKKATSDSRAYTVMDGEEGHMMTIILDKQGQPCKVGGRSTWTAAESHGGIKGPLHDWLVCGGLERGLDTRSEMSHSDDPTATLVPPYARITGVQLELSLYYVNKGVIQNLHNEDFDGVVCYARVTAIPVWTTRTFTTVTQLPNLWSQQTAYTYRHTFGVSTSVHVTGKFVYWFPERLLGAVINAIVILTLPAHVIRFLSLYGLGLLSRIYRNALRTPLNIYKEFQGVSARMMLAGTGYRGLKNSWTERPAQIPGLSKPELLTCLKDHFQEELEKDVLTHEDVVKMVEVIFCQLDEDGSGVIAFAEFVSAATSNDTIKMEQFAEFFKDARAKSCLENLLDDSSVAIEHANQKAAIESACKAMGSFQTRSKTLPDLTDVAAGDKDRESPVVVVPQTKLKTANTTSDIDSERIKPTMRRGAIKAAATRDFLLQEDYNRGGAKDTSSSKADSKVTKQSCATILGQPSLGSACGSRNVAPELEEVKEQKVVIVGVAPDSAHGSAAVAPSSASPAASEGKSMEGAPPLEKIAEEVEVGAAVVSQESEVNGKSCSELPSIVLFETALNKDASLGASEDTTVFSSPQNQASSGSNLVDLGPSVATTASEPSARRENRLSKVSRASDETWFITKKGRETGVSKEKDKERSGSSPKKAKSVKLSSSAAVVKGGAKAEVSSKVEAGGSL